MVATRYLSKRMVLVINQLCVELTGGFAAGRSNLRAAQALSFVDNIFHNEFFGQQLYDDAYEQAAAYLFHIIKNHTFQDGNKRTGLACAITFLEWNGVWFDPLPEEPVFRYITELAAGSNDPAEAIPRVASWLERLSREIDPKRTR